MKLLATTVAIFAGTASALSSEATSKLLKGARRLDDGGNNNYNDNSFLSEYTLKFVSCDNTSKTTNANGNDAYGVAVLRLCETEKKCNGAYGCKKHFGDIVVSLEDYVQAFFDDQADNMGWNDDKYDFDQFAQCDEYEPEQGLDDDSYANYQFYIGPTCTQAGNDIGLDMYTDQYCTVKSKIHFSQVSNGWQLPFSGGGLVSTSCVNCLEYNEDDAQYELRDMCSTLYDSSTAKCETGMRTVSSSGSDESGCKTIHKLLPKAARRSHVGVGAILGWLVFILLIGAGAYYVMWWKKQKAANNGNVVLS